MDVNLGPLKLRNPVVAASGFFGYGNEYAPFFDIAALGAFTTAPVGMSERIGARAPRLAETPSGVLRARDLGRMAVSRFVSEKLPVLSEARAKGLQVIVHLHEDSPEAFEALVAALDAQESIDAYEVAAGAGPASAAVLRAVRAATGRPVIARLPAAIPGIVDMAIAAHRAGADIISLIEAVPGLVISTERRALALGANDGLLSGPAIRPIALRCVHEVASVVDIPIIGMGGITTATDAVEFLLAGADAVAIASAIMANPRSPIEVLDGIAEYCADRGIARISELTGSVSP